MSDQYEHQPRRRGPPRGQRQPRGEFIKGQIEVRNRAEAEMINAGLRDPFLRALVKTMGAVSELPPDQRERVLDYVARHINDPRSSGNGGMEDELRA